MPFTRPRSAADIMTRSLLPTLEGGGGGGGALGSSGGSNGVSSNGGGDNGQMSRSSFASFHLTGLKPSSGKLMTNSVDRLFENEGEVFLSSNYQDFQVRRRRISINFVTDSLVDSFRDCLRFMRGHQYGRNHQIHQLR